MVTNWPFTHNTPITPNDCCMECDCTIDCPLSFPLQWYRHHTSAHTSIPHTHTHRAHDPPEEFLCPISLEVMTDPVIMVETAMTYDRASIEQHFASGNDNCPLSGAVLRLQHTALGLRLMLGVDVVM